MLWAGGIAGLGNLVSITIQHKPKKITGGLADFSAYALRLRLSYRFKKRIRLVGIEDLVGPHEGNEILGLAEVDDVMRVSRQHVNRLDLLTADLKLDDLVGADLPLLNEPVARDHNKELPLAVVPVLPFGDARLRDIHAELVVVQGLQKLGERASLIAVHLQVKGHILLRQVREIHAVELLLKAAVLDRRHDQVLWLNVENLQKLHNSAKRGFVGKITLSNKT